MTGYGTYCKICNSLIIPNANGICPSCNDAMKRNGFVKVVRCKDCKHRTTLCEKLIGGKVAEENWFCADGELDRG